METLVNGIWNDFLCIENTRVLWSVKKNHIPKEAPRVGKSSVGEQHCCAPQVRKIEAPWALPLSVIPSGVFVARNDAPGHFAPQNVGAPTFQCGTGHHAHRISPQLSPRQHCARSPRVIFNYVLHARGFCAACGCTISASPKCRRADIAHACPRNGSHHPEDFPVG
jgi:hypothetical protein